MASYRDVIEVREDGVILGPAQKMNKHAFLEGADPADETKSFHIKSKRVDPRLMDGYHQMAIPKNMPFFDHPLIPYNKLALDNLPPYGLRLSDNQVAHLEIWLRMPHGGITHDSRLKLLAKQFHWYWPADFESDGFITMLRPRCGEAWDGNLPACLDGVKTLFRPGILQSEKECEEVLGGGEVQVVDIEKRFLFEPNFMSCGLKMDVKGVLAFAENILPDYSLHGEVITRAKLSAWLRSGLGDDDGEALRKKLQRRNKMIVELKSTIEDLESGIQATDNQKDAQNAALEEENERLRHQNQKLMRKRQ